MAALSGGSVGYVYLPDIGEEGAQAFAHDFFPQADKAGLVVDVRYNPGGYLSPVLIDRPRVSGLLNVGKLGASWSPLWAHCS